MLPPYSLADEYYDEAQTYFNKGEYSAAIIQLKNALQENANDAKARVLLGRIYLKQREPADAFKELEIAKNLGAEPSTWAVPLGKALLAMGQTDKVIALSSLDLEQTDVVADFLAVQGYAKFLNKDIAGALILFETSMSVKATAYALAGQASIALVEQQADQANQLIKQALALEPDSIDAQYTQIQVLSALGQPEAAIAVAGKILNFDKSANPARIIRANLHIQLKNYSAAAKDIDYILKSRPGDARANIVRSRLALIHNDYETAKISAEQVLRQMPEHLMSHYVLGVSHFSEQKLSASGNFSQAIYPGRTVPYCSKSNDGSCVPGPAGAASGIEVVG